jgi:effector-binding domain-containing protein
LISPQPAPFSLLISPSGHHIGQSYTALMKWVEANKYEINGLHHEVYLKGPGPILKGNPANYITEIQLPVKK